MRNKVMMVCDAIIFLIALLFIVVTIINEEWKLASLYIVIAIYAQDSFKINRGIKS